jgi:predicted ATPase
VPAQHYAEAGLSERAVDYWTRAGKRSAARSAMAEAEAQLEKALAQLACHSACNIDPLTGSNLQAD